MPLSGSHCAGVRPFDGIAALESLRLCKEARWFTGLDFNGITLWSVGGLSGVSRCSCLLGKRSRNSSPSCLDTDTGNMWLALL